ncbi:MAG: hypothetical protein JO100_09420 [Pseudonocardia sp.]|nr:hypothetical protein [Pseudonocardia sp.]
MFQLSNGQILPVVGFARKAAVDSRVRDIFVVATFEAYRLIASFQALLSGPGGAHFDDGQLGQQEDQLWGSSPRSPASPGIGRRMTAKLDVGAPKGPTLTP